MPILHKIILLISWNVLGTGHIKYPNLKAFKFRGTFFIFLRSVCTLLRCHFLTTGAGYDCGIQTLDHGRMWQGREYLRGKYHCTVDLLFDWFGLVCFVNKNKNYQ
jgi:hypothetical protein